MQCKLCSTNYHTPACPLCGLDRYESAVVTPLHFGKHKGLTVEQVYKLSPSYLTWMMAHGAGTPAQRAKAKLLFAKEDPHYLFRIPRPEDQGTSDLKIVIASQTGPYKPKSTTQPVIPKVEILSAPVVQPRSIQHTRQQNNNTNRVSYPASTTFAATTNQVTKKKKEKINPLVWFTASIIGFIILGSIFGSVNNNNKPPLPTMGSNYISPTTGKGSGPTPTIIPTKGPSQANPIPSPNLPNLTSARVVRVIDGDTVDFSISGGPTERVRFIGMDTPETKDSRKPVMCFGQEATNKTTELLNQSKNLVLLEKDVSETDLYGRLLRYVWITLPDGKLYMLNEELVRWGFAQSASYPPDVKYQSRFVSLTKEASTIWRN